MWFFILFYFGAYGGMHAYFFAKWRAAFPGLRPYAWLVVAFMLFMIAAPILVRMLERAGYPGAVGAVAAIGHPWIAMLFWFCCLGLVVDVWNMTCGALSLAVGGAKHLVLPWRAAFPAIAVLVAAASVFAFREARDIRTREVAIRTNRLPAGTPPIRIAQLADLHLDIGRGEDVTSRVADAVRAMKPDLIVCTGDLADTAFVYVRGLADRLRAIEPPLGKYAVLGNHEFYVGLDNSIVFLHEAGFSLLRGESAEVGPHLRLTGVDDAAGRFHGDPCHTELPHAAPEGEGVFSILLKHQPLVDPAAAERFDLQLSGHTHGGQVFPFELMLRPWYRYSPGLHALGDRLRLYVSRGAGTWGPPMRLLAPPEVTLIVVQPEG